MRTPVKTRKGQTRMLSPFFGYARREKEKEKKESVKGKKGW